MIPNLAKCNKNKVQQKDRITSKKQQDFLTEKEQSANKLSKKGPEISILWKEETPDSAQRD